MLSRQHQLGTEKSCCYFLRQNLSIIVTDDAIMINNNHGRRQTLKNTLFDLKRLWNLHEQTFDKVSTKTAKADVEGT